MSITLLSLALFCAAAPPVKTSKTAETMLYVRTTPSGAEILLDEKPLGTSPGLFKVPPGVRRVVVELDGYEPGDQEVTIKAGHITRVVLRLSKRPGPAVQDPGDPVAEILRQFQAAAHELDVQKLEALFLPPDDPRAGQAWRKSLEEAKKDWPRIKSAGATMQVQFVGTKQRSEGKDRIVTTTIVARVTAPDGSPDEGRGSVEIRIIPTEEGWKIAEMTTDEREPPRRQPALTPAGPPEAPTVGPQRQRHFVRLVVGKDGMTFEGLETSWEELPALLEKVPNPKQTTLRISFGPAVPHDKVTEIVDLVSRFGFIALEITAPAEGKAAAGPPAATTQPLSFGPVIEQVLKDPEKRVAEVLDLDTGRWARSTEFGADDRKTHQWIREHKVDAMGAVEGGLPGLLLFDMAVYENPGIRWEAITAGEVVNHRWLGQIEPEPITALGTRDPAKLPLTCLFETREGSKGVLQLVGLSDDGQGVKIRYKLVEQTLPVDDLIRQFVEATLQGDEGEAVKFLSRPLGKNAVVGQLDDMREVASSGLNPAQIRLVTTGRDRALAVTEFAEIEDPKYKNRMCMVYTLVLQDGRWLIDDIDLEDAEGLAGELRRFGAESSRQAAQAARDRSVETRLRTLKTACQLYRLDIGDYPTTAQGLDALLNCPDDLPNPERWTGPYVDRAAIPSDLWGNPYRYEYRGQDRLPKIWSSGPDGISGNEDDVAAWE